MAPPSLETASRLSRMEFFCRMKDRPCGSNRKKSKSPTSPPSPRDRSGTATRIAPIAASAPGSPRATRERPFVRRRCERVPRRRATAARGRRRPPPARVSEPPPARPPRGLRRPLVLELLTRRPVAPVAPIDALTGRRTIRRRGAPRAFTLALLPADRAMARAICLGACLLLFVFASLLGPVYVHASGPARACAPWRAGGGGAPPPRSSPRSAQSRRGVATTRIRCMDSRPEAKIAKKKLCLASASKESRPRSRRPPTIHCTAPASN